VILKTIMNIYNSLFSLIKNKYLVLDICYYSVEYPFLNELKNKTISIRKICDKMYFYTECSKDKICVYVKSAITNIKNDKGYTKIADDKRSEWYIVRILN
jgi:hypothetical protein